ncbi:uncharacterized protein JN550_008513 [Neoarthrinium moseri]|uniref:uncharacterized protein n=1 Tax=Neoarthrinium moseri TaxID=1658444 RepID=UPI001FDC9DCF|nr:uncharacterized protein JN550_008513 [Neoarthrinium moseri]KAI1864967.1 hypothetical protein JN550_008513 [Neoarthrinium moseri]
MAIQNDTPSELVTIDQDYLTRVQLRRAILEEKGSGVHGFTPDGVGAVGELYAYLFENYLPVRFPTVFRLSKDRATLTNLVTKKSFAVSPPMDSAEALRVIGETIEEDVFLLQETPDGHVCVAFVCCFPSGFDPSDKLGKNLNDIHKPVPSYGIIQNSMQRYLSRLVTGKSVKRVNWTVQTHKELCNISGNHINSEEEAASMPKDVNIEETFMRSELQRLTRLPKSKAVLFSFKTYLYPVQEIKDEGLGPKFAEAIEGMGKGNCPGMWTYKGAVRWSESVCRYLRS